MVGNDKYVDGGEFESDMLFHLPVVVKSNTVSLSGPKCAESQYKVKQKKVHWWVNTREKTKTRKRRNIGKVLSEQVLCRRSG